MPGMGGRELSEALLPEHQGIKVLFMSGYTDDATVRYGVMESKVPFIQKPFTPEEFVSKVREVLDTVLRGVIPVTVRLRTTGRYREAGSHVSKQESTAIVTVLFH